MSSFADYNAPEVFVIGGTLVLLAILLAEALDWSTIFSSSYSDGELSYGYNDFNGPHIWKDYYPATCGERQSPINLVTRSALVVNPCEALSWSPTYMEPPDYMQMCNDGHCVILFPRWCDGGAPTITGGPLANIYELENLKIRWGPTEYEGSEHTVDLVRFALEIQVFYCQRESGTIVEPCPCDTPNQSGIVILSYLFKNTAMDNPYLEQITASLHKVRCPGTSCYLKPFPLNWITPLFEKNFFTYSGSLSYPPCSEGVIWIVQPEPIAISQRQLRKFRKLLSEDGPLLCNTRPVQMINNREIFFYE